MTLLEKIKQGFVFFDGGYGTILQAKGLKAGELPETYNVKIFGFGEEFNAVNEIYSEPISESVYKGSEEYTITLDIPKSDVHDFYRNFCKSIDGKETQLIKNTEVRRVLCVMEAAFESAKTNQVSEVLI